MDRTKLNKFPNRLLNYTAMSATKEKHRMHVNLHNREVVWGKIREAEDQPPYFYHSGVSCDGWL